MRKRLATNARLRHSGQVQPAEPGLFPTLYLKVLLSQRAGSPGDRVSLRVEGTDAASFGARTVLLVEQPQADYWRAVGRIMSSGSRDGRAQWLPLETETGPLGVTLAEHPATTPLYFDVPPIPPGEYRVRLDLIHSRAELGDPRDRTATLYAPLRVLAPP